MLTRPAHVILDPAGPLHARVTRAVPLEDGVRLELEVEHGRLYTVAPLPAPAIGDELRVRVLGGARFPGVPVQVGDERPSHLSQRRSPIAPSNRAL